ncbi:hypothetical protein MUK42_07976 [Musa troglodytarum]|uniref:Uncharacterized protein n=1 Tax=Musa troglodytarum TaxID=320322 RepID=A0A9E7E9H9_9LILI|nr:hypothetical protein MUK42_07976 [Musa troglodytarum]
MGNDMDSSRGIFTGAIQEDANFLKCKLQLSPTLQICNHPSLSLYQYYMHLSKEGRTFEFWSTTSTLVKSLECEGEMCLPDRIDQRSDVAPERLLFH